jgi:cardiolipin synthase
MPGLPAFVVSPANARKQLSAFIQGAKKQLLIYDPEVSDPSMIRLLEERGQAGVEIRIIGRLNRRTDGLAVRKMAGMRLHTRTIIRDSHQAFLGSQSLREVELGSRREVGIIFRDSKIVAQLSRIFEEDWVHVEKRQPAAEATEPATKVAKRVAKAVAKELPPVTPVLEVVVKEMVGKNGDVDLDASTVEATIKDAVKEAVQEVVQDVVENVVEQNGLAPSR